MAFREQVIRRIVGLDHRRYTRPVAVQTRDRLRERMGRIAGGPMVVSIGGNALAPDGESGNRAAQLRRAYEAAAQLLELIRDGRPLAVVHGNGPQVGDVLRRAEATDPSAATMALDVCDAETQGQIGYMLQQALGNTVRAAGIDRAVVALITQVEVSRHDGAFLSPTKPIGSFYSEAEARRLAAEFGWAVAQDSGRGWRRVVPSPQPLAVVEGATIAGLVRSGAVTICAGGGGIPVARGVDGMLEGVSAVIDKDYASALIAREIGAKLLVMTTQVEHVSLDFGTDHERPIAAISADDAEECLREGQFPLGSMGPKIAAALQFLRSGGRDVIITDPRHVVSSLDGRSGTRITR